MRASQALEVGSIPIARSNLEFVNMIFKWAQIFQALEQLLLLIAVAGIRFNSRSNLKFVNMIFKRAQISQALEQLLLLIAVAGIRFNSRSNLEIFKLW